jgi:hypothetical protein
VVLPGGLWILAVDHVPDLAEDEEQGRLVPRFPRNGERLLQVPLGSRGILLPGGDAPEAPEHVRLEHLVTDRPRFLEHREKNLDRL